MHKLSVTVTDEHARLVEEQIEAGRFASASELIREALRSFVREEAEFQEGLSAIRERVRKSLSDPRPSIDGGEVQRRLDARHAAATPKKRGAR
jgi:antitoxin ParD1/3/4